MKLRVTSLALVSVLVAACSGSGSDPVVGNAPPTISAIGDLNIDANNTSSAIGFTVSDEQPGNLAFTVMSDNQAVVADSGLALGGSGTSRSITATPVIDTTGDAFITIIVTDAEGLSASASFLLTVIPEVKSIQQFTRDTFALPANGEPELVNAVDFTQDADGDEFADLLTQ